MRFLILLSVVATVVAVWALQNGQPTTVTFLFWKFDAPLALIILAVATAGLAIGALIGWAHALQRWRRRPPDESGPQSETGDHDRPTAMHR